MDLHMDTEKQSRLCDLPKATKKIIIRTKMRIGDCNKQSSFPSPYLLCYPLNGTDLSTVCFLKLLNFAVKVSFHSIG